MFEDIIETAREPLMVLDADLRVLLASRSFYESLWEKGIHLIRVLRVSEPASECSNRGSKK